MFRRFAPDLATDGSALRLTSAGVDARPYEARCEWSAAEAGEAAQDGAETAQPIDPTVLHDVAVLLAADRGVVSSLIRLSPSVRGRTFTMKEAAQLGQRVLDDPQGRTGGLEELVDEMDARRGWLPIEQHATRRFRRRHRSWSTTLDVPDAHVDADQVRHSVMFAEMEPAITRIADVVSEVCSTT